MWATEVATDHIGAARALLLARRDDGGRARTPTRRPAAWPGGRAGGCARSRPSSAGSAGGAPSRPTGPVELTPREREVLALVAEGLTNAELAERLYISPRTAGVHVSNILAKLGMSSRTEAAAWAVRSGLGVA